jgi:drug/metabolite transporter (DMT)-like permease
MWIILALAATCLQTVRNAVTRSLSGKIPPSLNSWSRFAFHLPFSASLALLLTVRNGAPTLPSLFYVYCAGTALTQLLANVALVKAFERSNFAQSIVLHKLEVVFTAIIGVTLFSEFPTTLGWMGIVVCSLGVLFINLGRENGPAGWRRAFHIDMGAMFSLACAMGLVFAGFFLKAGSTQFVLANPRVGAGRFEAAAHTLFHTTWMEVVILSVSLLVSQPRAFRAVPLHWRRMLVLGFAAFSGSVGWFWAYSLTLVAYVKAVGTLESIFAVVLAIRIWRELEVWSQLPGVVLVLLGVALVVLG